MQYKTLSLLLLSATAMAAPQDGNNYSDLIGDLDSLASQTGILSSIPTNLDIPDIPSSVVEVLATAIPSTWLQNILTNSAAQTSVLNDLESSKYPDWWSSVPTGVQSYLWDVQSSLDASVTPTSGSSGTTTGSSATATSTSDSDDDNSDDSSSSSSSSSGAAASDTSAGAAPAQTAMAATVAGAAGILGLALAL
ncbi:hypothetical protein SI65_00307 [Aspergillus cristatus]|uniref:GPI anchored protein n=1 Tax=Aspergillus cristatus TaxID=573508 RepID=A0A1E3BP63_ASPCR|nr:hypothetical protein SI65_00307 [Aspergillus cristatus]